MYCDEVRTEFVYNQFYSEVGSKHHKHLHKTASNIELNVKFRRRKTQIALLCKTYSTIFEKSHHTVLTVHGDIYSLKSFTLFTLSSCLIFLRML